MADGNKPMNATARALYKSGVMAVCLLALASAANGQERRLTLPEAIDLALHQNRALKISHLAVAAEEQNRLNVRSNYFPTITNESNFLHISDLQRVEVQAGSFGAIPGGVTIPTSNVVLPQGEKTLESSGTMLAQPLTQLIKIHQADKIAAADVRLSESAARKIATDVVFTVRELYYRLLTTQMERSAAELQITSSSESLAESNAQYKDGALLQVDLVESRANTLEAKQTLLMADMQISDLVIQLNDVLGLPLDTKLVLSPDVDTAFDLPAREEAVQTAVRENPEVQEAVEKLSKAEAAQGAAKAEYIPDITGFARYSYQNGVPFLDHNFGTFGINFKYDLFDAGKKRSLVRERQDEVLEARENLERVKDEIRVRIATIYNKLETTRDMVEVARQYLRARQETARLGEDQFKQGASLASQRDASRAQAMKAQAGLLEASLDYLLARDELTRTLGATAPQSTH
jgi:outer membrane protein TolC